MNFTTIYQKEKRPYKILKVDEDPVFEGHKVSK
jgi:hypothetical protein